MAIITEVAKCQQCGAELDVEIHVTCGESDSAFRAPTADEAEIPNFVRCECGHTMTTAEEIAFLLTLQNRRVD
jgi:hypothetical protein